MIGLVLIIILFGIRFYLYTQKFFINIEKVGEVYSEKSLTGGYWFLVHNKDDYKFIENNITIPDIDYKSNNLIISNGREIVKIEYKRKNTFPYKKSHFVNVTFGKELHSHTWFIYKIHKIDIYYDERSEEVLIEH